MTEIHDSPAMTLLRHVWRHAGEVGSHSWERVNHAMRTALGLAIGANLRFEPGDLRICVENFFWSYWVGEDGEWAYTLAIEAGNSSAWQVYEADFGRTPYIADDVDFASGGGGPTGDRLTKAWGRKRSRLAVGFRFPWDGHMPKVTSFNDTDGFVVACVYDSTATGQKITQRYKITHADLRAAHWAAKAAH